MSHFRDLLDKGFPTSYPIERSILINRFFSKIDLDRIEHFLEKVKEKMFDEAEEEHIKG